MSSIMRQIAHTHKLISEVPYYVPPTLNQTTNLILNAASRPGLIEKIRNVHIDTLCKYEYCNEKRFFDEDVQWLCNQYNTDISDGNSIEYIKQLDLVKDYIKTTPTQYLEDVRMKRLKTLSNLLREEEQALEEQEKTYLFMLETAESGKVATDYPFKDFSFYYPYERQMLQDHWLAVEELGMQEFFSNYEPDIDLYGEDIRKYSEHYLVGPKYGTNGKLLADMSLKMQGIANDWHGFVEGHLDYYLEYVTNPTPK